MRGVRGARGASCQQGEQAASKGSELGVSQMSY